MTSESFDKIKRIYCLGHKISPIVILEYLDAGNDPNYQDNRPTTFDLHRGRTLLHYATSAGDKDAISLLVRRGADIDIQDGLGWTPLHHAADFDFVVATQDGNLPTELPLTRLLLQLGASDAIRNHDGKLPVDYFRSFQEVVNLYQRTKEEVRR
jgi:ankyrin repeat protein